MLNEFKTFIAKGNVMDMAVGIIIGAAFTAIVQSMVNDLINPIVGIFTGGIDFTNLFFIIGEGEYASLTEAQEAGAAAFAYGSFLNACINFLIIAFVVFMLVRQVNRIKDATAKKEEEAMPAAPAGPTQEELLVQIRDLLAK
ncbi:large conductance mechanosensitive channel protein MscL [Pontivivens insulae]|uniref:Large-conductance mechanosensitive channel n=1 Tax=Pontivivens insulae TaxID=1639689 RepID=A0A2R8A973_9RHOB|nr:large conductance mechanosensitive channel protein MscL [Pontivivens insulae]RED12690.1 large conductance mechanosensitive channel [Pontivivens insulae]SPF28781.1 Large-conductance mechanosensitive channel [Pontivivens insulae]